LKDFHFVISQAADGSPCVRLIQRRGGVETLLAGQAVVDRDFAFKVEAFGQA